MRRLLKKMAQSCQCQSLDQCGKGIFRSGCRNVTVTLLHVTPLPAKHRWGQ
jgi:hypothetical protein